jgi:hypothetical protein
MLVPRAFMTFAASKTCSLVTPVLAIGGALQLGV